MYFVAEKMREKSATKEIRFFADGLMDTSFVIAIDGTRKNKLIRVLISSMGYLTSQSELLPEVSEGIGASLYYLPISNLQYERLTRALLQSDVSRWSRAHYDPEGVKTRWLFSMKMTDGSRVHTEGVNGFPPEWHDFIRVWDRFIGLRSLLYTYHIRRCRMLDGAIAISRDSHGR